LSGPTPDAIGPLAAATLDELLLELERRTVAFLVAWTPKELDGKANEGGGQKTMVRNGGRSEELVWLSAAAADTVREIAFGRAGRKTRTR